jgi:curved DNA-binding protein CbpA
MFGGINIEPRPAPVKVLLGGALPTGKFGENGALDRMRIGIGGPHLAPPGDARPIPGASVPRAWARDFFFFIRLRYDDQRQLSGSCEAIKPSGNMKGQLSEQPLAELIREISAKALSGTLRLQREQGKVAIYFESGRVVYVASNIPSLRLAAYLKKHSLVPAKDLAEFDDKQSDLALAEAISSAGLVRRDVLHNLLTTVVADTLKPALLWTEGSWHFDGASRLADPTRIEVDIPRLLLESARKTRLKFAASRFPHVNELISPVTKNPSIRGLTPVEGFLLSRIEGQTRLGELISLSGLRDLDAKRIIYGLALAGFVQREWSNALRSEPSKNGDQKDEAVIQQPPAPPVAPPKLLSDEDELALFFARLDDAENYYEVLDVSDLADGSEVKQSYYSLARKFHPDRFRAREESLQIRIESAFARITQAYETLMDAGLRATYNSKLEAQAKSKQFARSAPKSAQKPDVAKAKTVSANLDDDAEIAENSFREGFAALQQGQINTAIGLLAAAARAIPNEPRYRAYYGLALGAQTKTRRLAETELQAAVRLDPTNAGYRVMLAELFSQLGFALRARSEAERALSIEPNNVQAKRLLRTLKNN